MRTIAFFSDGTTSDVTARSVVTLTKASPSFTLTTDPVHNVPMVTTTAQVLSVHASCFCVHQFFREFHFFTCLDPVFVVPFACSWVLVRPVTHTWLPHTPPAPPWSWAKLSVMFT